AYSLTQASDENFECSKPSKQLVVRWHEIPRRLFGRCSFHHIFDRDFVVRPSLPIAEVLVGELPPLEGGGHPVLESANLLAGRNVQKDLHYSDAVLDQQTFKLIDLFVTPPPFTLRGEALHALHQDPLIPGTVENDDLT